MAQHDTFAIQMKATEQYFPVVLFIMLYKVVLTFESVDDYIQSYLFRYASTAYQASLVKPWFVFWREAVEPKYPWRDQTSSDAAKLQNIMNN